MRGGSVAPTLKACKVLSFWFRNLSPPSRGASATLEPGKYLLSYLSNLLIHLFYFTSVFPFVTLRGSRPTAVGGSSVDYVPIPPPLGGSLISPRRWSPMVSHGPRRLFRFYPFGSVPVAPPSRGASATLEPDKYLMLFLSHFVYFQFFPYF